MVTCSGRLEEPTSDCSREVKLCLKKQCDLHETPFAEENLSDQRGHENTAYQCDECAGADEEMRGNRINDDHQTDDEN